MDGTIRTSILNYTTLSALAPVYGPSPPHLPYFVPKNSTGIDFEYYTTLIANAYDAMGWIKDPDYIQVSGNEITIENSSANERFNYTKILDIKSKRKSYDRMCK
jgi:hypothetical protein